MPNQPSPITTPKFNPEKPLAGQSALVTGANSGIGKAVALAMGAAGAAVAVNFVTDPPSADAVVQAMTGLSRLFLDHRAFLSDLEINPLIVLAHGQGARAVDVRMISRKGEGSPG